MNGVGGVGLKLKRDSIFESFSHTSHNIMMFRPERASDRMKNA